MNSRLVIFDFDGTLTYKDSMLEFAKFYRGKWRYRLGIFLISPILLAYKLGLMPNWQAKQYFLQFFFRGEPLHRFQNKCDEFARDKLPLIVRKEALQQLQLHQQENDQVVIISASAENWLMAWCRALNVNLIASRLQVRENHITGNLSGPNCYGVEKLNRLREKYNPKSFSEIIVYGDSKGDAALFEIATKIFYKPFR